MTFVVAIDGPAGTGKSSVAKSLAHQFDFIYVDTGAIYRALAYLVAKYKIDPNNTAGVVSLIPQISILVDKKTHCTVIMFEQKALSSELRTENISKLSSVVSQYQNIRQALLPIQRNLVQEIAGGAIFEGRDIGTVVFPLAPLKIFITANSETRAQRRYEELKRVNSHDTYEEILEAIKGRDERDLKRQNAPLHVATDAHLIDSSCMTLAEVVYEAKILVDNTLKKYRQGTKLW